MKLPRPTELRAMFERWARDNRHDLNLQYMYDADGNYHYDGYIWQDTTDAFRIWCAAWELACSLDR